MILMEEHERGQMHTEEMYASEIQVARVVSQIEELKAAANTAARGAYTEYKKVIANFDGIWKSLKQEDEDDLIGVPDGHQPSPNKNSTEQPPKQHPSRRPGFAHSVKFRVKSGRHLYNPQLQRQNT